MPPRAPAELWLMILDHLTLEDLASVSLTCQELNPLARTYIQRERMTRATYASLEVRKLPAHPKFREWFECCGLYPFAQQGPRFARTHHESGLGAALGLILREPRAQAYVETLTITTINKYPGKEHNNEVNIIFLAFMLAKDENMALEAYRAGFFHEESPESQAAWQNARQILHRTIDSCGFFDEQDAQLSREISPWQSKRFIITEGTIPSEDCKDESRNHKDELLEEIMIGDDDATLALLLALLPNLRQLILPYSNAYCARTLRLVSKLARASTAEPNQNRRKLLPLGKLSELQYGANGEGTVSSSRVIPYISLPSLRILDVSLRLHGKDYSMFQELPRSHVSDIRLRETDIPAKVISKFVKTFLTGPCVIHQSFLDTTPNFHALEIPTRKCGTLAESEKRWKSRWAFHSYIHTQRGLIEVDYTKLVKLKSRSNPGDRHVGPVAVVSMEDLLDIEYGSLEDGS